MREIVEDLAEIHATTPPKKILGCAMIAAGAFGLIWVFIAVGNEVLR
jgi:hypothetical protein